MIVNDLARVNPTVMRRKQSSVSAVGVPSGWKWPLRKLVLGCMTMATAAVPPAEFEMVSTLRVVEKCFLTLDRLSEFLWSVAVVMTNRPSGSLTLMEKS